MREPSTRPGEPSAPCSTASPRQNAQTTSETQDTLQPNQIALLAQQRHKSVFGIKSARPIQTLRWTQEKAEPKIRHGECLRRRLSLAAHCSRMHRPRAEHRALLRSFDRTDAVCEAYADPALGPHRLPRPGTPSVLRG